MKIWEDRENIVKYSIISYKVNSEYLTRDELRQYSKISLFKWLSEPEKTEIDNISILWIISASGNMSSEVPCTVRLPCYEGFNQLAIWPAHQSVSNIHIMYICNKS